MSLIFPPLSKPVLELHEWVRESGDTILRECNSFRTEVRDTSGEATNA